MDRLRFAHPTDFRNLGDLFDLRNRLDCVLQNRFGFRCVRIEAISEPNHKEPDT